MSILRHAIGGKDARISVCVPCRDMVHAAFAFDLARMLRHAGAMGLDVLPHFCMGTLIVNQRESLVGMAKDAGSTHILWLDSDMMFPHDTLQVLLRHDQPIVAANYATRQYPHKTVAYTELHDWSSYLVHDGEPISGLLEVEAIGMGCMLTSMEVIDAMALPRFQTTYVPESGDHMGEDFYFCQKARELGYKIWVDDTLSRDIGHLGTMAFQHSRVKRGLQ